VHQLKTFKSTLRKSVPVLLPLNLPCLYENFFVLNVVGTDPLTPPAHGTLVPLSHHLLVQGKLPTKNHLRKGKPSSCESSFLLLKGIGRADRFAYAALHALFREVKGKGELLFHKA